jgi:hypothetical protein
MSSRKTILAMTVTLAAVLAPSRCGALRAEEIERWRADLAFARERLLEIHPDPFHRRPRKQLDSAFEALERSLDRLHAYEVVVELAAIVASLGDGHSRLTLPLPANAGFVTGHAPSDPPADPGLAFHTLPVRLGLYREGLIVERIEARYADLAGARVVAIGGVPVDRAIAAVAPVIRHDNRAQLRDLLPMFLVVPEVLAARGLAPDRQGTRMRLVTTSGVERQVELRSSSDESMVTWVTGIPEMSEPALSRRHVQPGHAADRATVDRYYWLERLREAGALYVQLNRIEDDEEESLFDFAQRLRRELAQPGVERVVLDLRYNWGGDYTLSQPLLHALIASEVTREPGGLLVLAGRGTFSAAMMLAVDLERHLRPVFVGEPTGSSPNAFGDSRKVKLPGSGLTLRVSTLWWQVSDPRDTRDAIAPHLSVERSWRDERAGRDRALELALAGRNAEAPVVGDWTGLLSLPHQELGLAIRISTRGDRQTTAEIRVEELPETIVAPAVEVTGGGLRLQADTPFGPLSIAAVRLGGDRLAGSFTFAARPGEPYAFGACRESVHPPK